VLGARPLGALGLPFASFCKKRKDLARGAAPHPHPHRQRHPSRKYIGTAGHTCPLGIGRGHRGMFRKPIPLTGTHKVRSIRGLGVE
jgi:hypothetical protein